MGEYADGQANTAEQESAVQAALDETMASVQALTEAYADAYDEAMESFFGHCSLTISSQQYKEPPGQTSVQQCTP